MGSRLGRFAGASDDTSGEAVGGERVAGVVNRNPPGHTRTTRKVLVVVVVAGGVNGKVSRNRTDGIN